MFAAPNGIFLLFFIFSTYIIKADLEKEDNYELSRIESLYPGCDAL